MGVSLDKSGACAVVCRGPPVGDDATQPRRERSVPHAAGGQRTLNNFGRADHVDNDALARLVASISRFLEPKQAITAAAAGDAATGSPNRP